MPELCTSGRGMAVDHRPLVIANPASRGGRARQQWQSAASAVADRLGVHDLAWTQAPGDAERIAYREGGRRALIVAFGGDGTASEVAEGIRRSGGEAELGLLPCGTGNDFASDAGIPARLSEAVRVLAGTPALPTDLGLVEFADGTSRCFLNSVSLGLAAAVAARALRSRRRLGRATYVAAAASELLVFHPKTKRIAFDGEVGRPRLLLDFTVLNSTRFGAGIRLAPQADPGDGRLDAVLIGPLGPGALLDAVRRLIHGTHFGRPELEHRQIRRSVVRCLPGSGERPSRNVMELDGEVIRFRGPLKISVLPQALRVRRRPRRKRR